MHTLLGNKLKFADFPVGRDDIKTALNYRSSLAEQVNIYIYIYPRGDCAVKWCSAIIPGISMDVQSSNSDPNPIPVVLGLAGIRWSIIL